MIEYENRKQVKTNSSEVSQLRTIVTSDIG